MVSKGRPDLLNNVEVMSEVYSQYPRSDTYPHDLHDGKHSCTEKVIYCKGDWDIIRCTLCGNEYVTTCRFDDDYD